ncbi:RNA-guided endonuclease TnpB family protein [Halorubrum distributum]|uniref:RNA-guided endonuclease TnpB family protein n=1 Tax=Halorubrum distributum TaxID=29283 RepID=UPI00126760EF|nr:RNA-guided endonuclease TnpB family protein [Halorubrum distributum]
MADTATVTKTLEATLVDPTAHKERKLRETVATYQDALETAFDSEASTQSEINDLVTGYDLTSYAKDALKQYVPQLEYSYDADELAEDHPVRFTHRGLQIDHSSTRAHEFCWRVPQAGYGTGFWIPLRINPDQKPLWFDLLDGTVSAGEFRLTQHRASWTLHVTVKYSVEDPEIPDDPTHIGFDVGESTLLTGCALQHDAPTDPFLFDGSRARRIRKEMYTTLKRLQERDSTEWRIEWRFEHFQNALTDIVEKSTTRAVEYACQFDSPVIVLEDLSCIQEQLDHGTHMNRRLHSWAFAQLISRLEDKALEASVPVEFVPPAYTSKTCHECGHIGSRSSQAEFKCTNPDCWVTEYQADINAAANIAHRADPWGESVPWKTGHNDSPRNGCPRDRALERREKNRNNRQMTLSEYSSETSSSNETSPVGSTTGDSK